MPKSLELFKDRVRRLAKERGGISHFASEVGVSQPTLSKQLGQSDLKISTMEHMAESLNIPLWQLIKPESPTPTLEDEVLAILRGLDDSQKGFVLQWLQTWTGQKPYVGGQLSDSKRKIK